MDVCPWRDHKSSRCWSCLLAVDHCVRFVITRMTMMTRICACVFWTSCVEICPKRALVVAAPFCALCHLSLPMLTCACWLACGTCHWNSIVFVPTWILFPCGPSSSSPCGCCHHVFGSFLLLAVWLHLYCSCPCARPCSCDLYPWSVLDPSEGMVKMALPLSDYILELRLNET